MNERPVLASPFGASNVRFLGEPGSRRALSMVAANKFPQASDTAITEEIDQTLGRTQRRLLRRIYNGREVPITVDGTRFLTYKEASRYLQSLTPEARDKAYAEMKSSAGNESSIQA